MRILIIEDEVDFANALSRGLKNQGYAVDVAKDGEEGWELGTVNPYDLVILDLSLPLMDGLEATKIIRSESPHIPIIAQTANAFESDHRQALDAGCNEVITKPIKSSKLLEVVEKYINGHKQIIR